MRRMSSQQRTTPGASVGITTTVSRESAAEWLDGVHALRVAKARCDHLLEECLPELFAAGICSHGVCKMLSINTASLYSQRIGEPFSRMERMIQKGFAERAAKAPLMVADQLSQLEVQTCMPCERCLTRCMCKAPDVMSVTAVVILRHQHATAKA